MDKLTYHGYAHEDLARDSPTLKVFCPEMTPAATQGSFAPGITTAVATTFDDSGITKASNATTANHIVAEWYGDRWTSRPPIIRCGEQVELFQFHDTDKWYWLPLGRDRHLRQTDEYRLEISASSKVKSDKTDANTYSFVVSSDGRYVHLKTAKDLGEPYAYCFRIDTQSGTVVLSDDNGDNCNRIVILSEEKTIHINNTDGATSILKGKDIIHYAPRDILFQADRQILMNSPIITLNNGQVGTVVINAANIALNSAADTVITAARFGVSAVSKFFGTVVTGTLRAIKIATGSLGSAYVASTTNPNEGTATANVNESDVNTDGDGDRIAAAYDQVNPAFEATASAIKQVAAAVGMSIDTSPITNPASQSNMDSLKGN